MSETIIIGSVYLSGHHCGSLTVRYGVDFQLCVVVSEPT